MKGLFKLVVITTAAAVITAMLPDIKRYIKISMM
jgi:hypothetical protein